MDINIEHIAKLARISLSEPEKVKFAKELENILGHFEELRKLDTEGIMPMAGGTDIKNSFREEMPASGGEEGTELSRANVEAKKLRSAFPDSKGGFLKVPKIFDEK